jgi:hypothetical protein
MRRAAPAAAAALALIGGLAHAQTAPDLMAGMDMSHGMAGMDMGHAMTGALGPYPMTREGSGTSWQPDTSEHDGLHLMRGPWSFMAHALLNGVYDSQSGPRGGDKAFASGMIMLAARRDFEDGDALNLRAMFSPEPFMGSDGYPLLFAAGETANGRTPLIDRQHPHDLVMELSASYAHRLSAHDSVFVYGGLPGEPAFGPPAFMHRLSGADNPEAPITHHWLDSTHITFGVLTVGWIHDDWKIETSSFRGREPDQRRFDIETPKLDSAAVRLSWNPAPRWSLQASWAHLDSPEQLAPLANEDRVSASVIYTRPVGAHGWWSTTAAFGHKDVTGGERLDGWLLETAFKPAFPWTLFARAEAAQPEDLLPGLDAHATPPTVGKLSVGAIHDWRVAAHLTAGLGALYDFDFTPAPLKTAYGPDPHGAMGFMRLKID